MDAILYWNGVALETNRQSHSDGRNEQTGPPLSARALGMTHLAMRDAYAGIPDMAEPLEPYLPGVGSAAPGASVDAAIGAAAHAVLSALFPSQRPILDMRLAAADSTGTPGGQSAGRDFGRTVAEAILAERAGDAGAGATGYQPSQDRGDHRVDPENPAQGFHAPFYGARTRSFALTERFTLKPPPEPDEDRYLGALREVRAKGIAAELSATLPAGAERRTPLETLQGLWWAYDGATNVGTPPRLYNQIIRQLAQARGNSLARNAELFALVNVAMADAGILAWEQKYSHDLWRPVLGVREHDPSGGPQGLPRPSLSDDADPGWLPHGSPATNSTARNFTPPFPSYPSGHATFGAAAFGVARLFYGVTAPGPDPLADGLSFVSDEFNGISTDNRGTVRPRYVRQFPGGLWQMLVENSLSRIYLGVHWSFDGFIRDADGGVDVGENVGGVPLGLAIAEDIYAHGLHLSEV